VLGIERRREELDEPPFGFLVVDSIQRSRDMYEQMSSATSDGLFVPIMFRKP
jgi:hypothetical protein